MQFLYPSDPFNKNAPEAMYEAEFLAMKTAGFACSVFCEQDFEEGRFKARPALAADVPVVYRGWMLTPPQYTDLHEAVRASGANMLTSPEQYVHCHHLPGWYEACEGLTPNTLFFSEDADFEKELHDVKWPGFFVKDYVKSLTTSRGSIARTHLEIADIVSQLRKYRGHIEGGICVRELEELVPTTEERYFVVNGVAYGRCGVVPDIVSAVVPRIDSPFFSVDVVLNTKGEPRIIELGDGQVSDRKEWEAGTFAAIFPGGMSLSPGL